MKNSSLAVTARSHLAWVRANKSYILVDTVTLSSALNYLQGFHAASGYTALRDFEMWLIVRAGEPTNFAYVWTALARLEVTGEMQLSSPESEDEQQVDDLFDLVDAFLADAEGIESMRAVYREYEKLRRIVGLD